MSNFLTVVFILFSFGAICQTPEEKLTGTLKQFHQDLVKKNIVSINQQTDKAMTYGHSNGWLETKTDMIKNLESNYMTYQFFKEDSIRIDINANVASARFVADIKAVLNGNAASYRLRVLEVWVKKGNRWVLFARQAARA